MALSETTKARLTQVEKKLQSLGVERSPKTTPSKYLDELEKRIPHSPSLQDCLRNRKEAEQFIAGLWGYM